MFIPTEDELADFLDSRPNQGRWGPDDQLGTLNLITPEKIRQAAQLVKTGERISVSRPLPVVPTANNPTPFEHVVFAPPVQPDTTNRAQTALDYYGMAYHGQSFTHLDGLSHQWDRNGLWSGREPEEYVTPNAALWAGVEQWQPGIITRGVLLDVPRHRGRPAVTQDAPVHGDELRAIADAQGVELQPGDALLINCGREAWERETGQLYSSTIDTEDRPSRPGLHASCLWFLRDVDAGVLVWDMLDAKPFGYQSASVHGAIYSLGQAIIDNADLESLSQHCAQSGIYEFLFMALPLVVVGGTGSPVNPVAVF